MSGKDSPQDVINAYKKSQQMVPFLVGGLAILLVAIGIIVLVVWLSGPNGPSISLFASATPTPTSTYTPTPVTPTATATMTPTETVTPSPTVTFTPSGPQEYTIQDGDTCWDISIKYNVDLQVLLALNNFPAGTCPISVGQKILVPAPGQSLPTATPLPTNLAKGTKIQYVVQLGDTLGAIAARFNTTIDAILKENNLKEGDTIQFGQTLVIPYGLATRVPTLAPTSTPRVSGTPPTKAPTAAVTATAPATATKAP